MKKKQKKQERMFKPVSYLKHYKTMAILGPVLKALEALTEVITPFFMAMIIDKGVVTGNKSYIWWMSGVILGLNLLAILFAVFGQKCLVLAQEGMGKEMRRDIYKKITSYSYAELDKFSTASLLNRTLQGSMHIYRGVGAILRQALRAPVLLIGCSVLAMMVDLKLSIIFIVLIPVLVTIMALIMKKMSPLLAKAREKLDRTTEVTRENLTGVRVVRAFNNQDFEISRFDKTNDELIDVNLKVGALQAALPALISFTINIAIFSLLYFGGVRVNAGTGFTQGNLIAFINYFGQISSAVVSIIRLITIFTRMKTASDRIEAVFQLKTSITDPEKPVEVDKGLGASKVEFKNVSFSYDLLKDVVIDLSVEVNPGETIGIIGGTGSGKSSIVNLIPRLYDATKGEVLINDVNVKKYRISDLRDMVGIVPQNPALFEGTIRDNMRWRKKDATDEEITKALITAQAYEFVKEYPDFLDHPVRKGGTNFSGGQRQRLTIARALVGQPNIVILDDSASALDLATDANLRRAIKHNAKKMTTFIVSQRTNSIKDADKIIVIDGGDIVGIGKHEELLQTCEIYREIHNSQSKREVKVNG